MTTDEPTPLFPAEEYMLTTSDTDEPVCCGSLAELIDYRDYLRRRGYPAVIWRDGQPVDDSGTPLSPDAG
jgi:hypothetical protein